MSDFFQWLSSGSTSSLLLLVAFGIIVIITILIYTVSFFEGREISFWPPKIGEKPENKKNSSNPSITAHNSKKSLYGISITSPIMEQTFYSINEDFFVEVSGKYEAKPESGKTLRLFTKTNNPARYWYQSSIPDFNIDGQWRGEVGLWKNKDTGPYQAFIIAVVVDEAGESLIRYAEKVHRETGRNIPFDNLPVHIEMCGEVKNKRE